MKASETSTKELLEQAASHGIRYLEELSARMVFPAASALKRLQELGGPLPVEPTDATEAELRRAQPGAGVIRQRRNHAARDCRHAGGWHVLVRRHCVARPSGDAHQRIFLGDDG
jgi:hypothetical protein